MFKVLFFQHISGSVLDHIGGVAGMTGKAVDYTDHSIDILDFDSSGIPVDNFVVGSDNIDFGCKFDNSGFDNFDSDLEFDSSDFDCFDRFGFDNSDFDSTGFGFFDNKCRNFVAPVRQIAGCSAVDSTAGFHTDIRRLRWDSRCYHFDHSMLAHSNFDRRRHSDHSMARRPLVQVSNGFFLARIIFSTCCTLPAHFWVDFLCHLLILYP